MSTERAPEGAPPSLVRAGAGRGDGSGEGRHPQRRSSDDARAPGSGAAPLRRPRKWRQHSAGEPDGGGVALGSNGSLAAPQIRNVLGTFALLAGVPAAVPAGVPAALLAGVVVDTVATVCAWSFAVDGAAAPWHPASSPEAATSAAHASDRRAAGLMASPLQASGR